jgi:hypothetical protein
MQEPVIECQQDGEDGIDAAGQADHGHDHKVRRTNRTAQIGRMIDPELTFAVSCPLVDARIVPRMPQ